MKENTKRGALEMSNKKVCFNGVRLSVKRRLFVFDEEHFELN